MYILITATVLYLSKLGSCIKCTVGGQNDKGHTYFNHFDCPRRTDAEFRSMSDYDHHAFIGLKRFEIRAPITPLVELPIDMINAFTIADDLHLLFEGIMKRLAKTYWIDGEFGYQWKLTDDDTTKLDTSLLQCDSMRPQEIQRNIRGLKWQSFWKATEFRVLLLYVGLVILEDVLPPAVYIIISKS